MSLIFNIITLIFEKLVKDLNKQMWKEETGKILITVYILREMFKNTIV